LPPPSSAVTFGICQFWSRSMHLSTRLSAFCASAVLFWATPALFWATPAFAGPETALREFAGGQVKKGVRTIGMGGDGATTGNYALVYKDASSAIVDEGVVTFGDTGNLMTFSAVGFTTPTFWNDAAFYIIALTQRATDVSVWSMTPTNAAKPASRGNLSDSSVFVKFAKPITSTLSFGLMGAFELSDALLLPDNGGAAIRYQTSYLPSGGAGLHWHPDEHWQVGARVILNHDWETRTQGTETKSGLLRSYEYRLGVAYAPWPGTLLDVGVAGLDRANHVEGTATFVVQPTLGIEQVLVKKTLWLRGGLDETTWTGGASIAVGPMKLDMAVLRNLAAARTGDVFGKSNWSVIGTLGFDYERFLKHEVQPQPKAPIPEAAPQPPPSANPLPELPDIPPPPVEDKPKAEPEPTR
jgi:hypothetical protein